MPERSVDDYFKDGTSPFLKKAGKLTPLAGEEDFLPLSIHKSILSQIKQTFRSRPVSIRLVISQIGGGKTWTFGWLWREMRKWKDDNHRILVLGIPRLELRRIPERALVEAVFRSIIPIISELRREMGKIPRSAIDDLRPLEQYLFSALNDETALSGLTGESAGRLPRIGSQPAPSISSTEGSIRVLLGLFRVLRLVGFTRVLLLVDESEAMFLAYSRTNLLLFSDFIRNIYDEFESDAGEIYPSVQILFSGTPFVLEEINPILVGKQGASTDVSMALQRRVEPPTILTPPTIEEIEQIAEYRIGIHRKRSISDPYIPYDMDAIRFVWERSGGSVGEFCASLQRMYEVARQEGAQRITKKHAEKTFDQYSKPQTEPGEN